MKTERNMASILSGYPKEVILRDGTGVTLRPLEGGDDKALYDMFKRLSTDELWFLNYDVSDPGSIREWISHLNLSRVVSIVALLEGRIIANGVLMMKEHGAKSHIGKVRVSVDPSFRERRLATWMLLDLVNLGMALQLQMLVMRLVQDKDVSVINSVKRLGFEEEAILKDYVLDNLGAPHNLVIMTKRLPLEWEES